MIWNLRIERLQIVILPKWNKFTIWNAGKQGRKFYNSLTPSNQLKVEAMCDVDTSKVGKQYNPFNLSKRQEGRKIDIIHYSKARPPFVICVKLV